MHQKKYIQLDAKGRCFHEIEYQGESPPKVGPGLLDVTDRTDGPWLGKVYTLATDTFAWPEPTAKLTASARAIAAGEAVTLRSETTDALSADIDQGVGPVELNGEVEVRPASTTTYTLTATGHPGTTPATSRRKVTVI